MVIGLTREAGYSTGRPAPHEWRETTHVNRTTRSTALRAIGLLSLASVFGAAMAIGPATGAPKPLTKKKAHKLFLTPAEGSGMFIEDKIIYRRGAPVDISDQTDTDVEALCPAGAKAIAGGVYTEATNMYVEASTPSSEAADDLLGHTGWVSWVYNDSGGPAEAQAYVVCLTAANVDSGFAVGEDPRDAFTP